ncbi:MAG: hypothetical protein ACI4MS_00910 [Candidatus Coproplasma sp.]
MQKLVVKTAVKTVLILLGIIIGFFAIFNFSFPQHMATAMESVGNYDMAVKYANLRYFYTKNCYDLARCFDDSVLAEDDENVISYGEKLINDVKYPEVCNYYNRLFNGRYDYNHKVNSCLMVSYFNMGQTDKAIDIACEDNGTDSFEKGNLIIVLSSKIYNTHDAMGAEKLLLRLENITPVGEEQQADYNYVIQKLRSTKLEGEKA